MKLCHFDEGLKSKALKVKTVKPEDLWEETLDRLPAQK